MVYVQVSKSLLQVIAHAHNFSRKQSVKNNQDAHGIQLKSFVLYPHQQHQILRKKNTYCDKYTLRMKNDLNEKITFINFEVENELIIYIKLEI